MRGGRNKFKKNLIKNQKTRWKTKFAPRRRYLAIDTYLSRIFALKKVMAERRLRGQVQHALPNKINGTFLPSSLRLKSSLGWMVRLWKWRNDLPLFYGIPVSELLFKNSILSRKKYESLQLSPLGLLFRKKLSGFSLVEQSIFRAVLRSRLSRKRHKYKLNLGCSSSFGYKLRRTIANRMSFPLYPETERFSILNGVGSVAKRKARLSKKIKSRSVDVSLAAIWRSFINGPRGVARGSLFYEVFQQDTFPRWLTIPLREKITMQLELGSWFTKSGVEPVSMLVNEDKNSSSLGEGFLFGKIAGSSYYLGVFGRGAVSNSQLALQPGVNVYLFKVRKTRHFIKKLHSYLWTIYRFGVESRGLQLRVLPINSKLTKNVLEGIKKKKSFLKSIRVVGKKGGLNFLRKVRGLHGKRSALLSRFLFVYSYNPLFKTHAVIPSGVMKWFEVLLKKQRLLRSKKSSLRMLVQKQKIERNSRIWKAPRRLRLSRFSKKVWYRLYSWIKTRYVPGISRWKRTSLVHKNRGFRTLKVRNLYRSSVRFTKFKGRFNRRIDRRNVV